MRFFLFVRLIPGHDFTAYNYSKYKYDELPYKYEGFLDQPDCKTYGNPQKPEHQLQEQHIKPVIAYKYTKNQ